TITLESSWALNTLDVIEAATTLCGDKAGADMRTMSGEPGGVRINGVKHGKQYVEIPDLSAGGVDFYEGSSAQPGDLEQKIFYSAIQNGTPLCVLPEQALVVTQILEAIYESSKTGKPVYFD
ncbi:MAG: gfo/Idh/MocA family oxidoreductase, partial [Oscillospiraceae bacterium]|nr:gfo/Idh/MocA family oxidoreductase [Oscillospiraceae bacterium]